MKLLIDRMEKLALSQQHEMILGSIKEKIIFLLSKSVSVCVITRDIYSTAYDVLQRNDNNTEISLQSM